MSYKIISELKAGYLRFTAYKSDTGNINFNLTYGDKVLVSDMDQEAAKLFCGCVTDVLKRQADIPAVSTNTVERKAKGT